MSYQIDIHVDTSDRYLNMSVCSGKKLPDHKSYILDINCDDDWCGHYGIMNNSRLFVCFSIFFKCSTINVTFILANTDM